MAAPLDENILSLLPHPTFAHLVTVQASLVVQTVKNPPAVWEDWVQSLDPEDPLDPPQLCSHSRGKLAYAQTLGLSELEGKLGTACLVSDSWTQGHMKAGMWVSQVICSNSMGASGSEYFPDLRLRSSNSAIKSLCLFLEFYQA